MTENRQKAEEEFQEELDRAIARMALAELTRRWGTETFAEPPHCEECFDGCPKCQPELFMAMRRVEPDGVLKVTL